MLLCPYFCFAWVWIPEPGEGGTGAAQYIFIEVWLCAIWIPQSQRYKWHIFSPRKFSTIPTASTAPPMNTYIFTLALNVQQEQQISKLINMSSLDWQAEANQSSTSLEQGWKRTAAKHIHQRIWIWRSCALRTTIYAVFTYFYSDFWTWK